MTATLVNELVLPDAPARRRALLEHERTLLVEAGAGSGKTSLLAGRIALLLAEGNAPREIVAITFTEAAASELRHRIEEYVRQLCAQRIPRALEVAFPSGITPRQADAIRRAAAQIDELTCTTIHGFCRRLITPYPVEAAIDPGATLIEPAAGDLLYQDLLEAWLSARFGRDRAPHASSHAPERRLSDDPEIQEGEDDFLVELVRHDSGDAVRLIKDTAHFLRTVRTACAPPVKEDHAVIQALRRDIEDFVAWYRECGVIENKTAADLEDLGRLAPLLADACDKPLTGRRIAILLRHERPGCRHSQEPRFKEWKRKTAWCEAAKNAGRSKTQGEILSEQGKERYDQCSATYRRCIESLAGMACARFIVEFDALKKLYAERKQQAAVMDFDDLLHHARDVLARDEPVRRALGRRYPRIFVDEFQDTDPLQAEILWLLCGEGDPATPWMKRRLREGSLFLVGDPKQAIYRFRGADIGTYADAKNALLAARTDAVLEISANFRSRAPILAFVNERFKQLLSLENGQPGFAELLAMEQAPEGAPAVKVFDLPLSERHRNEKGRIIGSEVRRDEANVVADLIVDLLATYEVWDKHEQRGRPCRPGDIALLAPTGTDLWEYERALEQRGLSIASQAGKGFFRRQEVQDLIALTRALADPRDTLAFGALIRGPLVGLSEEEIADVQIALERFPGRESALGETERLTLWTDPERIAHPVLRATLERLRALARSASRTTPYQVLSAAVEELNVRAVMLTRHAGSAERGLANVEQFLESARAYDARGLRAFAHAMRERWEDAESEVEGRPDAESEATAIITMHASKGLEWPIVIPINTMTEIRDRTRFFHRRDTDTVYFKILDATVAGFEEVKEEELRRQSQERVRLWYVALTRARELLLLPRQSERVENDWMGLINLDLTELPSITSHVPLDASERRLDDSDVCFSVADGRTNAQDTATWAAQAAHVASLRKKVLWQNPGKHEEKVVAVEACERELIAETVIAPPVRGGRERGIMLHKLMEEVLTGETKEDAASLRARAGVLMGELGLHEANDPREGLHTEELSSCVLRAFALPEVAALRERLVPEMPVYSAQEDETTGTFMAGVADALAYDQDGRVEAVIDWKSDVDPSEKSIALYREQVAVYCQAMGIKRGLIVFLTSGCVVSIA